MATRNKIFLPNEIYFITFTILGWRRVFTDDKYTSLVYKWFDYMEEKYGNKVVGYVIMPNHLHVLLRVTDKSPNVPKLVQNGKRFLAYDIVRLLAEEGRTDLLDFFKANAQTKNGAIHKVFEDGYDSLVIQSRKMFLEKLNYIHNNPCALKWQLADCAEIYKHSSAANYAFGNGFYKVEVVDF